MIRNVVPPFASPGDSFTFEIYGDSLTGVDAVSLGGNGVDVVSFIVIDDGTIRGRAVVANGAPTGPRDVEASEPGPPPQLHQLQGGFTVL